MECLRYVNGTIFAGIEIAFKIELTSGSLDDELISMIKRKLDQ